VYDSITYILYYILGNSKSTIDYVRIYNIRYQRVGLMQFIQWSQFSFLQNTFSLETGEKCTFNVTLTRSDVSILVSAQMVIPFYPRR